VVPVVGELAASGVPVSIDTMRAEVALACLAAGAAIVNDVSGGVADPGMLPAMAGTTAPYIVMHWRGHGRDMDAQAVYTDVAAEVVAELGERLDACVTAGISRERVVLDPGLGFAKHPPHNWALLHALDRFADLGQPLLVGASRKRFLGALLADAHGPRQVADREAATTAVSALAAAAGVWAVRVHDARASADAVRVAAAWRGDDG
jgi:dihydropteroate synthase